MYIGCFTRCQNMVINIQSVLIIYWILRYIDWNTKPLSSLYFGDCWVIFYWMLMGMWDKFKDICHSYILLTWSCINAFPLTLINHGLLPTLDISVGKRKETIGEFQGTTILIQWDTNHYNDIALWCSMLWLLLITKNLWYTLIESTLKSTLESYDVYKLT